MTPSPTTLKDLTHKSTIFLALLSERAEMSDTAFAICQQYAIEHDSCVFIIHKLFKTSRPDKHVPELTFTAYSRLRPIVCLSEYGNGKLC